MAKKKLIICGAAGFLGQNLVPMMKDKWEIVALDYNKKNLKILKDMNPNVDVIYADLSKPGKWQDTFKGTDHVVQLNAQISATSRKPFIENNVKATQNIVDAMKKHKLKYIVHVSSASVNSIRRDDYANTKEDGEKVIIKSKLNYSILRPSMMFGLFDNKNLGYLIKFMKKMPAFPMPGTGKYPRQPVYAKDFCNILMYLSSKKPKNNIYNINGDAIHFIDMIRSVRKSRKLKRPIILIPIPLFILMMKTYNFILRKSDFTGDQIKSLTTGEVFEDYPWWSEFGVKKTDFQEALDEMSKSKHRDLVLHK